MTATSTDVRLTEEEVAKFHRDGFLAREGVASPADVKRIIELIDGLFERVHELPADAVVDLGDVKHHTGKQAIPQINMPSTYEPRLKETQFFRNVSGIARQLLGSEAMFRFEHTIYKPGNNGKETPWHQVMSYPVRSTGNPKMIQFGCNFWLALQDTSVDMGCMQFIPHSHLGNLRDHHSVGNDPKVHTLMTDDVDPKGAVPCPLKAGGITIHQPKTLHYTGPNKTSTPRRAYILFFGYPVTPAG